MRGNRSGLRHCSSGQALVETALVLPILLTLVLNTINLGYFFLVALNLAATPRSGAEYSTMGFATPAAIVLPDASSVYSLMQADMTGALNNPSGASIQICSESNILGGTGVTNAGSATQTANCVTCTSGSCGSVTTGDSNNADPESPSFVLQRVDVTYSFRPLIPGLPFNLAFLPLSVCSVGGGGVTCSFHRQISMRAMD